MRSEKKYDDSIAELLKVSRELHALIEDNNQNIKDCYRTLKKLESIISPPKQNVVTRVVRKILNKLT